MAQKQFTAESHVPDSIPHPDWPGTGSDHHRRRISANHSEQGPVSHRAFICVETNIDTRHAGPDSDTNKGSVGISAGDYRLMAAASNVKESTQHEDWWLPGKYALVFANADSPWAVILLMDDERIVRLIHIESLHRAWQQMPGDFILPPNG